MKRSTERILTTHVGSLPRPPELLQLEREGRASSEEYQAALRDGVKQTVQRECEVGLDVINDGEIYKPSWSGYIRERLNGFENQAIPAGYSYNQRGREAEPFARYFGERGGGAGGIGGLLGAPGGAAAPPATHMVCVAPVEYVGQAAVRRDIENLKAALTGARYEDVFMASVGPDNVDYAPGHNAYYASEGEYIRGTAAAMKAEYKAITDAGFILQIDTPVMKFNALQLTVAEFRQRFAGLVETLNETLSDIPVEQVRIHICFGGGRGPHTGDIMLRDFMDLVLQIHCTGISFDQNVRHEHEWTLWKELKLPDDKVLIPGVVAHTTDTVEHPELVAQRIVRYANLVGRERMLAGTDCGLGNRLHPDIVWAKFRSQAEGARLATEELWGRS